MKRAEEYDTLSRTKILEDWMWSKKDWRKLKRYAELLKTQASKQGLDERPQVKDYLINFKSFCGTYPLSSDRKLEVLPKSEKLDKQALRELAGEVVEWATLLGQDLRETPQFSLPLGRHEIVMGYSNKLIELTENILAEAPPPTIDKETKVAPVPFGPIDVPKTSRHLSQGETLIASSKTNLEEFSLPMLLLVRFHYELLKDLREFLSELKEWTETGGVSLFIERMAKENISYHQSLLTRPRFRPLLREALETKFEDPEVLDKTLKEISYTPSMKEVVFLWEAYKGRRSMVPLVKEILSGGYTLKPVYKLYEVWALKQFASTISGVTGVKPAFESVDQGAWRLQFRKEDKIIDLFYNTNPSSNTAISDLIKPSNLSWSPRPDYLLTIKKEGMERRVLLVADAKYKSHPTSSDTEEMLAYLLSYCWPERDSKAEGVIVYIGNEGEAASQRPTTRQHPDATVHRLCLRLGQEIQALNTIITRRLQEEAMI